MRSPRARTLIHLQALVTAAATANAVACGKKDKDGYGVVDPMPLPTALDASRVEPPKPKTPAALYDGKVTLTTKREVAGNAERWTLRFTPAADAPDLVLDDVVEPSSVVKKQKDAKTREIVVTVDGILATDPKRGGVIVVVTAHGEAGTFRVRATAHSEGNTLMFLD